jgi:hypothetical protein
MVKRLLSWPHQDGSRNDRRIRTVTRRQLLQAAGLAAAGPALMGRALMGRDAMAAAAGPPLRLVCWPMMNGVEAQFFYPGGSDASVLSSVTEPMRKYASLATFIKSVNVSGSDNHYATRATYSGGAVPTYDSPDPNVKSVDQLIADSIATSAPTPLKSLHLGVIPADSIDYYKGSHSKMFYDPTPVDYEANPVTAYDRLFGTATAMPPKPGADFTNDSLDIIDAEMNELEGRMPGAASEINKLALHREALKNLRPSSMPAMVPMPVTSGPLTSVEKLRPLLLGKPMDAYKSAYFSDMFDAQVDIMARVLISGQSRVATLQAGSADNDLIVPVGRGYPHHVTSHGDQTVFSTLVAWYFGKMARFLDALNVPDPLAPGSTVLDNTVIVSIGECLPYTHSSNGVPALYVGKLGGKIKPGAVVDIGGGTNKTVMATILQAFGVPPAHFGTNVISQVLG